MRPLASFIARRRGRAINYPGSLGGQCVDLVEDWCRRRLPVAVAADLAAPGAIPGWTWEANGPVNAPPPGAVVVWRESAVSQIGPAGHCAIVVTADAKSIISFDQNWPVGFPCSVLVHDYASVAGWHVPPAGFT